jgi:CelD/BcsL family acetyltransferase involved in cellulose biosynthesis
LISDLTFGFEPAEPLRKAERLWKDLEALPGGSFFTSWTWIGTWLQLLPPELAPQILTARQAGKTIAAAVLISRARKPGQAGANELHFNSTGERHLDCVTIEHNGFAGVEHTDPELWHGFFKWFSEGRMGADELLIPGIENRVIKTLTIPNLLQRNRDVLAFRAPLHSLANSGGFEASLSRNARQQLRRAKRAYAALGELQLENAPTVESALQYFDALKELHTRSWTRRSKPHAFHYPFFEEFHRALIKRGIPEHSVRLMRISAGSRPLGYLYNFQYRGKVYAYQSGFDDENPALRPGYVSHALAIEAAMSEGAEEYDFLAGSNQLKHTFAHEDYVMSWCTLRQPKLKFRAEAAVRYVADRIAGGLCR